MSDNKAEASVKLSGFDGRAPRPFRLVYMVNVIAQSAIIVTGAVVRITGSGLGCPTWPECVEGSLVPTDSQAESWHKYVEFGNRLLTFVLVAAALATLVCALLDRRRRRAALKPARRTLTVLAAVPLIGTAVQAGLGGVTVLTGLHPGTVAAHFLLSLALVVVSLTLVIRAAEPADTPKVYVAPPALRALTWAVVGAAGLVVVLGVATTGSGPHSGDSDVLARFPIDPRMISWLHADAVWLFLGLTLGLLVATRLVAAPLRLKRRVLVVLGVSAIQASVGYSQHFLGLPEALVTLHVLGAVALWIAVWLLPSALRTRGLTAAN